MVACCLGCIRAQPYARARITCAQFTLLSRMVMPLHAGFTAAPLPHRSRLHCGLRLRFAYTTVLRVRLPGRFAVYAHTPVTVHAAYHCLIHCAARLHAFTVAVAFHTTVARFFFNCTIRITATLLPPRVVYAPPRHSWITATLRSLVRLVRF